MRINNLRDLDEVVSNVKASLPNLVDVKSASGKVLVSKSRIDALIPSDVSNYMLLRDTGSDEAAVISVKGMKIIIDKASEEIRTAWDTYKERVSTHARPTFEIKDQISNLLRDIEITDTFIEEVFTKIDISLVSTSSIKILNLWKGVKRVRVSTGTFGVYIDPLSFRYIMQFNPAFFLSLMIEDVILRRIDPILSVRYVLVHEMLHIIGAHLHPESRAKFAKITHGVVNNLEDLSINTKIPEMYPDLYRKGFVADSGVNSEFNPSEMELVLKEPPVTIGPETKLVSEDRRYEIKESITFSGEYVNCVVLKGASAYDVIGVIDDMMEAEIVKEVLSAGTFEVRKQQKALQDLMKKMGLEGLGGEAGGEGMPGEGDEGDDAGGAVGGAGAPGEPGEGEGEAPKGKPTPPGKRPYQIGDIIKVIRSGELRIVSGFTADGALLTDPYTEVTEGLPVEVKTEYVKTDKWVCPHCKKEIGEKEFYSPDMGETTIHSPCGGEIDLPSPDYDLDPWIKDAIKDFAKSKVTEAQQVYWPDEVVLHKATDKPREPETGEPGAPGAGEPSDEEPTGGEPSGEPAAGEEPGGGEPLGEPPDDLTPIEDGGVGTDDRDKIEDLDERLRKAIDALKAEEGISDEDADELKKGLDDIKSASDIADSRSGPYDKDNEGNSTDDTPLGKRSVKPITATDDITKDAVRRAIEDGKKAAEDADHIRKEINKLRKEGKISTPEEDKGISDLVGSEGGGSGDTILKAINTAYKSPKPLNWKSRIKKVMMSSFNDEIWNGAVKSRTRKGVLGRYEESPSVKDAVIFLDGSGSMDMNKYIVSLKEMQNIVQTGGSNLKNQVKWHIMVFNSEATYKKIGKFSLKQIDKAFEERKGHGGTEDLVKALKVMKTKVRGKPDMIFIFSDFQLVENSNDPNYNMKCYKLLQSLGKKRIFYIATLDKGSMNLYDLPQIAQPGWESMMAIVHS